MLSQSKILSLLALLTFASAAPAPAADPQYESSYGAPGGGGIPCGKTTNYKDLGNSQSFQDPAGWKQTGAPPVTTNSGPETLSATNSVSYGITITEGASIGADLPDSIFDLGFDFSVSWSKTTTTGYSSGVSCPAGQYTCGMSSLAYFVNITGTGYGAYTNSGNCVQTGPLLGDTPFSFQAPYLLGNNGQNQNAEVDFSACICATSVNQKTAPGLGPCPEHC